MLARTVCGHPAVSEIPPDSCPDSLLLGNTAKSLHASIPPDLDPGYIRAARARRYEVLDSVRAILRTEALSRVCEYAGDVFRTVDCRWKSNGSHVSVLQSIERHSCHYGGLQTCGSVWNCPVCASVIQERRRLELVQLMAWAKRQGFSSFLVTFTFPHYAHHYLGDLLGAQAEAYRILRNSRGYKRLLKRLGYQGLVRSLEVTHGRNGFHPHTHELWILRDPGNAFLLELISLWEHACIEAGLLDPNDEEQRYAFLVRSVDVRCEVDTAEYLQKVDDSRQWDFTHEIAKATSKAGRQKGVHPFHFVVRDGPGDAGLFIQYCDAMKGRRQLVWSPGLKDRIGLNDRTDEELADEQREPADLLGLLGPAEWRLIRGHSAQALILTAAETGGWESVQAVIDDLTGEQ